MATGIRNLSYWQMGKESSKGTAVPATRQWYSDALAPQIDDMIAEHRGSRGTNTRLAYGTSKGITVDLPYTSDPDIGMAYDELPFVLSQIKGGQSGVGGAADKTWTHTPTQTSQDTSREAFTTEIGDDNQCLQFEYTQASDFTISAANDGLTELSVNWFARQPTKTTKTAVSANQAVRIAGDLWKIRFATAQSGLTGASDQTNLLLDWSLNVQTGLVRRKYQDGTAYFGQTLPALELGGTLTLHVESTALAITEFYDKKRAQTIDFCQLKAVGPTLGGTNYSSQIQLALLYTDVVPFASEDEGVNVFDVTAKCVIDPTWANSMSFSTVCSIGSIT